MSRKFRAEQQRARARMRDWRRAQLFRGRMRVYLWVSGIVGSITFYLVLMGQLR